jgi:hypothetical protein
MHDSGQLATADAKEGRHRLMGRSGTELHWVFSRNPARGFPESAIIVSLPVRARTKSAISSQSRRLTVPMSVLKA